MYSGLRKMLWMLGLFIGLAGCENRATQALYTALPINTDGNSQAPITLVEFLDYANPACRQMAPILQAVVTQHPNVRIIYHPLVVTPQSAWLTELVVAAGMQDRFLAAHHLVLSSPLPVSAPQAITLISHAFVDPMQLSQQMQSITVQHILQVNHQLAQTFRVAHVPTFFIGRTGQTPHKLVGVQSAQQLLQTIDEVTQ